MLPVVGLGGDEAATFWSVFPRDSNAMLIYTEMPGARLEAVNAASRLEELRVPPLNRLEKLKGDLGAFHSIRINDQWRINFKWLNGEPHAVQIVDYH
jgi:proteic killer suppression protein